MALRLSEGLGRAEAEWLVIGFVLNGLPHILLGTIPCNLVFTVSPFTEAPRDRCPNKEDASSSNFHRELVAAGYINSQFEYPSYRHLWRALSARPE